MQISDLVLLSYESSKHKTKGSMLLFLTVIHVKFNIKQKFAKFTSEDVKDAHKVMHNCELHRKLCMILLFFNTKTKKCGVKKQASVYS